ncbi:hypothetical protein C3432_00580 [Citrobacter amalonaticus]|uniref:Uncharacterized protein n=1 Tax=Citrobacter amalonaticus TaxID=35703 RepID=A0A2S4S1Y0_CITAM|nr:T3SS effector OspC family protein [Citrobacter amalonaticus]POT59261.1 hypothetical protein C3432_00580 [Citrobacter amalonaticus]POT77391.1 hypothetical protein C3436_08250 [Citrobacter amalonaticus]POU67843.1 hypothetical protein C3430_01785 [Citrobacter amalonaticus]POV07447.1 hypothetical protein C3424_01795 [Citrobacter amalonaticus]
MKMSYPLKTIQQSNFACPHSIIEKRNETGTPLKRCTSVHNSQENLSLRNNTEVKAANIIKNFFRKTIAAQSYSYMFSNGVYFKIADIDLEEPVADKAPLSTLEHLDKISRSYLTSIKEKTQNLTPNEKELLSKVVDAKWHFRHQSSSNLSDGHLNILSLKKTQSDGILTGKNTFPQDMEYLANHDFVFFAVEFSDDEAQLPLNTRFGALDFGANAYILDEQFPYGYLTLTDHFYNSIPCVSQYEHADFASRFSEVRNEVQRKIHGEKGTFDVPVYSAKNMKLALGLHLIDFLRQCSDVDFKNFALNENLDSKGLDRILNFVFQPEFHVPRMVSTAHFKEVELREMSMKDAIKAANIQALSRHIHKKDDANKAMRLAIECAMPEVTEYLFSKFEFSCEDMIKMTSDDKAYDIECRLTNYAADISILKNFLERGLVDPNKIFIKGRRGNTMLDNAMKIDNQEMIDVLLNFGAVSGKDLITNIL